MNNYYRITGYCPENDFSFIIDSNGMFEKLWQFSSFVLSKGLKVLEVSKIENMIDVNIDKIEEDNKHIYLRALQSGQPENIELEYNNTLYKAIRINNKIYIPDKTKIIY